jgi:hypothetical protein
VAVPAGVDKWKYFIRGGEVGKKGQ